MMPAVGDRVKKRGSEWLGTVESTGAEFNFEQGAMLSWVRVRWDDGKLPKVRPLHCHPKELEVVGVSQRP